MVFTQAFSLRLNIGQVIGVMPGDFLPVIPEVAFNAVSPLQFKVRLLYFLKQG